MSSWARITGDQSFVQKFETVSEHSCSQLQICHAYVGVYWSTPPRVDDQRHLNPLDDDEEWTTSAIYRNLKK